MQFKLFRGVDPNKVEAAVNEWLSSFKGALTIHHTNTSMATSEIDEATTVVTSLSVWYEVT